MALAKKRAKKATKTKKAKTVRKAAKAKGGAKKKPAAKKAKAKPVSAEAVLIEKLTKYVRGNAQKFLEDPNVTSVGIGYRQRAGKTTDELTLQFTVGDKVRPEDLGSMNTRPIPKAISINGTDVPTDVIERKFSPSYRVVEVQSEQTPQRTRRERADRMRPGISVGSVTTTAGTLGAFVQDRATRQTVILSNWHVLHGSKGKIGDDIVQPGKYDDNRVDLNKIGKLMRSHLGAAGDCAIASFSGRDIDTNAYELGVPVTRIGEAELGDKVVKSGRTTGVTRGIVTRISVNTRINYGDGYVETVGGFEIGPDPDYPASNNEISSGGDSGSAWHAVDKKGKATDVMLGLHFAGDTDEGGAAEFALACYAKSVFTKLEIDPLASTFAAATVPETDADKFRLGFDRDFLPFRVEAPTFTQQRANDLAKLDSSREIKYCHFSVWLSKKRKYPLCVAWNVDGANYKRVNRTNFRTDRRGGLDAYQLNDDIYVYNALDRGHIARRADLCWGSLAEAKQGNYDSFYFTNIAPQHEAFNQSDDRSADSEGGVWGRLENAVFDDKNPHDLHVSLMGGPVISNRDKRFTQDGAECSLPREYWKVVVFEDDDDGEEKVFAFLLTQAELVDGLSRAEGLNFDDWIWARISLQNLEEKTGVRFPKALHDREQAFSAPQVLGKTAKLMPILRREDYFA